MTVNRSDFQKGRLASVSAADTIIVNDEDGTLEPQVIDFAGLAASAPFTGAFWPNSSTALTGAGLANDDRIPVLDGSVPKYIEADELAQGSQFSSRYKPLASDTIWLPAPVFGAIENSPTLGIVGNSAFDNVRRNVAWLFDTSVVSETVGTYAFTPSGWATADIYLWWSNAGAGAGDVVWQYAVRRTFVDGTDLDDGSSTTGANLAAVAAPLQYVVKRTKLNTSALALTADTPVRVNIRRRVSDAADTLANDAAMLAVEIVRAS